LKHSKNASVWMLALAMVFLFPLQVFALEESEIFYANDAADVLTEETEYYICDENYRIYDQCMGAEVVVVTVDFLNGRNAEEYAYEVFNDWALGDPDENNGVLILLSPGEEKYWIMAGAGLTGDLPAGKLDEICADYMEAPFDSGDYDAAALDTFKAVVREVDEKYGISRAEAEAYWNGSGSTEEIGGYDDHVHSVETGISTFARIFLLIILLTIVLSVSAAYRSITRPRPIGMPRPGRFFWTPVFRSPRPPRTTQPPPRPGGFFGGTGSSTGGRRSTGGGMSRGSSPSRSSFGSRSRSSFGGSRSSSRGGRIGGGGRSRGGGGGRR